MAKPGQHERHDTQSQRPDPGPPCPRGGSKDDSGWDARALVWSLWAILSLAALACTYRYGVNLPYGESWELVPVITGTESLSAGWLWEQQNEHRLPLTKLLLVVLGRLTTGDSRAGMYLNGIGLAATAWILIRGAQRIRGHASYTDAFFPLVLLHLGNQHVMVFDFAVNFVATVFLAGLLLQVLTWQSTTSPWMVPLLGGLCLIGLILCGATGLVFAPAGTLWLGYAGLVRRGESGKSAVLQGNTMLAFAGLSLLLLGLYFVGYQRPSYHPASAGWISSLKVAMQFVSVGIGPAGGIGWPFATEWPVAGTFIVGGCVASAVFLCVSAWRFPSQRVGIFGLLSFLLSTLLLAMAIGWGRSGMDPTAGFSFRYVTPAVLPLLGLYYTWGVYGPRPVGRLVQFSLFAVVCGAFLLNCQDGRTRARQGHDERAPIVEKIRSGTPPSEIAARHRQMLNSPKTEERLTVLEIEEQLTDWLKMLREARMGPYQ